MKSNYKLAILVISIPLAGLIYCGLGVAAMIQVPFVRENPLVSGGAFILVPFAIAASIWMRASAKAYQKR